VQCRSVTPKPQCSEFSEGRVTTLKQRCKLSAYAKFCGCMHSCECHLVPTAFMDGCFATVLLLMQACITYVCYVAHGLTYDTVAMDLICCTMT